MANEVNNWAGRCLMSNTLSEFGFLMVQFWDMNRTIMLGLYLMYTVGAGIRSVAVLSKYYIIDECRNQLTNR